eukprot:2767685-Amphidinium_carterae.1
MPTGSPLTSTLSCAMQPYVKKQQAIKPGSFFRRSVFRCCSTHNEHACVSCCTILVDGCSGVSVGYLVMRV